MSYFLLNKPTEEIRNKFSMAANYLEKKTSNDSIVRLMALSMVKKGEIREREPRFPFQFQNVKEGQLKKMEMEHQRNKQDLLRLKAMQKKLKKSKAKQEKRLTKQIIGKSLAEIREMLEKAQDKKRKDEQKDSRMQSSKAGNQPDLDKQMRQQKHQQMNTMAVKILSKIVVDSKLSD